jgi:hypothetical protein
LHDGFFARADTGLSLFRAHVSRPLDAPGRTGIRGIGQSTAISIGGTPAAGLVVGGQIAAARIDPSFVENGTHHTPDDDSVKLTLARIGPFATWYPELRGGFHVNAALALAFAVESDDKGNPVEPGSAGPALSVALGHDWFVASELSLGLLARATFSVVTRERADRRENVAAEMVEFALSYTYH